MKYPFTPEILDAMPEYLAEVFRGLEDKILREICRQLKTDKLNEVSIQSIRALRSHGIDLDAINKAIRETAQISERQLTELFDDVIARNEAYYTTLIASVENITAPERLVNESDIDAIRRQTLGEFRNITQTMGFLADNGRTRLQYADAYQWALDKAEIALQSGTISYNQAIQNAVKELADSGLRTVGYESGHIDHIDVAVRRAVMTGVSQVCSKYTAQSAGFLNTNLFEVSAHVGARDKGLGYENHKAWQGKVYSTAARDKYPSIYEDCGLGEGGGLEGWNCRHRRWAFVEGVSERTYTDEELEHIDDGHDCEFEGKHYSAYEATQKQREIERTIRKLKREKTAYDANGQTEKATAVGAKLRRLSKQYTEFSKAADLPRQRERMKVYEPNH